MERCCPHLSALTTPYERQRHCSKLWTPKGKVRQDGVSRCEEWLNMVGMEAVPVLWDLSEARRARTAKELSRIN